MALTDNLISYWKLDESSGNAADSVASNTGTNTSVSYSSGKINNGADFNGTSSELNFGSDSSLDDLTAFSISVWLKPTTFSGSRYFLGKTKKYATIYGNGQFRYQIEHGTTEADTYTNTGALTFGSWNHVVVTYSQAGDRKIRIYINGSEASYGAQTASAGTLQSDASYNFYAASINNLSSWYYGSMDELGIWGRAISSAEVTSLYNGGSGLPYPLSTGYTIAAALGTFALTGNTSGLKASRYLSLAAGTYILGGYAASLRWMRRLTASAGAFILTGYAAVMQKVYPLAASAGSFTLTGYDTTLKAYRRIFMAAGSLLVTLQNVLFDIPGRIQGFDKPTTTFINQSKTGVGDTWDSIATTWDTETRTWDEVGRLIDNQNKQTSTITNINKP